ncbi:MAG TPA: hypothetical protein VMD30_10300 [Tepidisphaeraceae bacterium]|nr:hypothetical protein [Tepidisphaeraceae bacterium]
MSDALRISRLALSPDRRRVTATVDGNEIFFETDDVPLTPAPESLAGAMLLAALQTNRPLIVEDPLESGWLENAEKLSDVFGRWWNYPRQSPIVCDQKSAAAGPVIDASAACFTGGVDSFHLQLKGDHPTPSLVFVQGFDILLEETVRFGRFKESMRAVCDRLGKKSVIVRTNLSVHPTFKLVSWERSHAAALAAVAHVLGGAFGTFVIPSSFTPSENMVWGSHWRTDPLWSSSRVKMLVGDADLNRTQKIFALAGEELAQSHLRVCFMRTDELNCSRCPKCLRTMTILKAAGTLDKFSVFEQKTPLAELIDGIQYLGIESLPRFSKLLQEDLPADVKRAWRNVFRRTYKRYHPSLLRRSVRRVRSLLRGGIQVLAANEKGLRVPGSELRVQAKH